MSCELLRITAEPPLPLCAEQGCLQASWQARVEPVAAVGQPGVADVLEHLSQPQAARRPGRSEVFRQQKQTAVVRAGVGGQVDHHPVRRGQLGQPRQPLQQQMPPRAGRDCGPRKTAAGVEGLAVPLGRVVESVLGNVGKVDLSGKSFENYKGSFGVTTGTALSAFYGSRHTHIFGSEIKFICDPEDVLAGKLGKIAPMVSALVSGIGGNTTYTCGTATGLTYFGPKTDILRGEAIKRTSQKLFGTFSEAAASHHNKVDTAIKVAVAALTLLLFAVAAGMEMYIRVHYSQFNPANNKQCNQTTELMADLGKFLTVTDFGGKQCLRAHRSRQAHI